MKNPPPPQVGRAVLTRGHRQRAIIIKHAPYGHGGSPGILVDLAEPMGNYGRRIWLISEDPTTLDEDPEGPFAAVRPFTCTNPGCYYHRNQGKTALSECPQCSSALTGE